MISKIKVFGQLEEKEIDSTQKVEINRYLEAYKKASDLKEGDNFLFDGAWYLVESVVI